MRSARKTSAQPGILGKTTPGPSSFSSFALASRSANASVPPLIVHQIVNIRHIQNHAAGLATRLRRAAGITVPSVGKG